MSRAEPGLEAEVFTERIRALYAQAPAILVASACMSPLAAWVFRNDVAGPWLALWLACQGGVIAWRWLLWRGHRASAGEPALAWARRFAAASTVAGTLWMPVSLLFLQSSIGSDSLLVAFCAAGIFAGASTALGAYWPAYLGFILPGIVPFAVLALLQQRWAVGFAALATMLGNLGYCRRLMAQWDEATRLRLLNARLLAQSRQAGQAKARFLSALSHDLRHPLRALELHVEGLSLRGGAWARALRPVEASASSLSSAFNGLLDLARLQDGAPEAKLLALPLEPLFRRLALSLGPSFKRQGAALLVEATPLQALADPVLLERLLRNLLDNAVRHGGKRVTLGAKRRGRHVWILVGDDGPGLPKRGAGPSRTRDAGLGLGIVRQLAQTMGLQLRIRSGRRGTRFELCCHLAPQKRPS